MVGFLVISLPDRPAIAEAAALEQDELLFFRAARRKVDK